MITQLVNRILNLFLDDDSVAPDSARPDEDDPETGEFFNHITWEFDPHLHANGIYDLDMVDDDFVDRVRVPQVGPSVEGD